MKGLELERMEPETREKIRKFRARRCRPVEKDVLAEGELGEEAHAQAVTRGGATPALGPGLDLYRGGVTPLMPSAEIALDLLRGNAVGSERFGERLGGASDGSVRRPREVPEETEGVVPEGFVAETPVAAERSRRTEKAHEEIDQSDHARATDVIAQKKDKNDKKPEHGRGSIARDARRGAPSPRRYTIAIGSRRRGASSMPMYRSLLVPSLLAAGLFVIAGAARAQPDLYVPDASASSLLVVDAANGALVDTVRLSGPPTAVAVATGTGTVYVGLSVTTSSKTTTEIVSYDPTSGALGPPIVLATTTLSSAVEALAVDPTGTSLYASTNGTTLYGVDLENGTVTKTINLGGYGTATDLVLSPNGHTLYFALPSARAIGIYDPETGGFGLLSLGNDAPLDLALDPSGARLYASEPTAGQIAVVDTDTGALLNQWTAPSYPEGIAVSPDGSTVYVASAGNDLVAAYNAASGTEEATAALAAAPSDLALTPDGTELYALVPSDGALAALPAPTLSSVSLLDLTSATLEATGDLMGASDILVTNQSLATGEGTQLSGTLTAQDSLGRSLTFSLLGSPSHGSASVSNAGAFSYTPNSGYVGIDRFTFLATASSGPGEPADPVSIPGVVRVCVEPSSLSLSAPSALTVAAATPSTSGPSTIPFTTNAPCGTTYQVTSSNSTLFPSANLGFAGIGAKREILLTPAAHETGTATITLSGTTSEGAQGTASIAVVVADPPTISSLPSPIGASENSTYGPLPFTVGGTAPLTVTASSDNPSVVAQSGIVIGGSGTNRTLTVTPVQNAIGSAQITISVTDGNGLTTSEVIIFEALSTGSSGALGLPSLFLLAAGALLVAWRRRHAPR
jgi:hypothetical protein